MIDALLTHLGFEPIEHRDGCTGSWDIDHRTVPNASRHNRWEHGEHKCTAVDEDGYAFCDHSSRYAETTIRLVCRAKCGAAYEIKGENVTGIWPREAVDLGIDLAPKKAAGYWLHAGRPHGLYQGQPDWYVVATKKTGPLTEADVVGSVAPMVTRRGAVRWTAGAGLQIRPGYEQRDALMRYDWQHRADLQHPTVAAAVKWIAAQLAEAQ